MLDRVVTVLLNRWPPTTQPKSDLALWGVPSLGHCGVAPRLCAADTSSLVNPMTRGPVLRLALTSNPGLQIANFILWHPPLTKPFVF